jgi:hypothetical protein
LATGLGPDVFYSLTVRERNAFVKAVNRAAKRR